MKILFFGDVVGAPGRRALELILPGWKKKYKPDLILANGENLAHGRGVTKKTVDEILGLGVDLITLGDHTWDKKEVIGLLEDKDVPLIRPANFSRRVPGQGFRFIQFRTKNVLVVNLIGRIFMREPYGDPFQTIDAILEEEGERADVIIVDWHTEATSEKVCMGWHLDGRVSAVLGTHTHIPTADARILPGGAAYISDVGMVGAKNSSLGLNKEIALKRFLAPMNQKPEMAEGDMEVNAVLLELDDKNKAKRIELLQETVVLPENA